MAIAVKKEKLGQKIYKFVGDKLILCRLVRVKNDNAYVVKECNTGYEATLTKAQYKSYTKLREDGLVVFSAVELQDGVPDVIVSLFRNEDLAIGEPYAVCRQNLYDVFTNTVENDGGMMYIGCSISKDTCPENVDFKMLIGCNKVTRSDMVAIYYDDDMDDILSMVKSKPYDEVLAILNKGFIQNKVRGSVSTLEELLKSNHFIDDVYRGFNIVNVNFKYEEFAKVECTRAIEDIIKREMIAPVWAKYERDIDLSKIADSYILVLDNTKTLYVVSYTPGEYSNRPYLELGDTTEVDAFRKLI